MKKKSITASEFDEKFELGEDLTPYLDLEKSQRPGLKQHRVSVDFPNWMVKALDKEAERLGITKQSVIKFWLSEKIKDHSFSAK
ncbi:MAG: hypothetical protein U1C46_09765 [Bacteroidales bacterium]|nr:CopG family antitoxin [Bacteroidales bacterium]MDZ4205091.1 hypothetical protein [Bacteroidales bacterium]